MLCLLFLFFKSKAELSLGSRSKVLQTDGDDDSARLVLFSELVGSNIVSLVLLPLNKMELLRRHIVEIGVTCLLKHLSLSLTGIMCSTLLFISSINFLQRYSLMSRHLRCYTRNPLIIVFSECFIAFVILY